MLKINPFPLSNHDSKWNPIEVPLSSWMEDGGGGEAFAVWLSASPPSLLSKTPEKQSKHFYKEIYIVNQLYFNKNISIFF